MTNLKGPFVLFVDVSAKLQPPRWCEFMPCRGKGLAVLVYAAKHCKQRTFLDFLIHILVQ